LSEIRVTTVSDTAGTGPVTLTKQSAAKAWCYVEGDASSPLINSFNGSSLTDSGTGDYTFNLTNNFNYAKYSVSSNNSRSPSAPSVGARVVQCDGIVVGSWGINTYSLDSSAVLARLDESIICSSAHGDLA